MISLVLVKGAVIRLSGLPKGGLLNLHRPTLPKHRSSHHDRQHCACSYHQLNIIEQSLDGYMALQSAGLILPLSLGIPERQR